MRKILVLLFTLLSFGSYAQRITSIATQGSASQAIKNNGMQTAAGGLSLPIYASMPTKYYIDPLTSDTVRINIWIDSSSGDIMVRSKINTPVKILNIDSLNAGYYKKSQTDSLLTYIYNKGNHYTDSTINTFLANAVYGGSVGPSSNPAPTINTYYFATQSGTYTNMGGVVVNANSFAIISYKATGAVWSISQSALDIYTKIETITRAKAVSAGVSEKAPIALTKINGSYYFVPGGAVTSSAIRQRAIIDVNPLTDIIEVSGYVRANTTALAVYFDTSMAYISSEGIGVASAVTYTNYLLSIPLNAKYVGLSNIYDEAPYVTLTANRYVKPSVVLPTFADLAVLKTAISYNAPISFTPEGGYFNTIGVAVANADRQRVKIPINPLDSYYVTARTFGNAAPLVCYYADTSASSFISYQNLGSNTPPPAVFNDFKLTIPSNAHYIGVTNYLLNNTTGTVFRIKHKQLLNVDSNLQANNTSIVNTNYRIDSINNRLKEQKQVDFTSSLGYYNKNTGVFASNSIREVSPLIPVLSTDKVYYTGRVFGDVSCTVCYYTQDSLFISSQNPGNNSIIQVYNRLLLTIPSNAKFIGATNYLSSNTTNTPFEIRKDTAINDLGNRLEDLSNEISAGDAKQVTDYKYLIMGNSITAANPGWVNTFVSELKIPSGNLKNFAISGARFSFFVNTVDTVTSPSEAVAANNVFWNQLNKFEHSVDFDTPDVMIIAGGTNEISQNPTNVGTYAAAFAQSLDSTSQLTGCGAFRRFIQRFQMSYPNTQLFWCSPIQGVSGGRTYDNLNALTIEFKKICNRLNVKVIDNFYESGIVGEYEPGKFSYDGTHTNGLGGIQLGRSTANSFYNQVLKPVQ